LLDQCVVRSQRNGEDEDGFGLAIGQANDVAAGRASLDGANEFLGLGGRLVDFADFNGELNLLARRASPVSR